MDEPTHPLSPHRLEEVSTRVEDQEVRCPECGHLYPSGTRFCPEDGSHVDLSGAEGEVDPLLGRIVQGAYLVLNVLGDGGVAVVYKVKHMQTGATMAMKVLRRELSAEPEIRERFSREARAIARVEHPNVVRVAGVGSFGGIRPFFLMEELLGETLAGLLGREGKLSPLFTVAIATQIAQALTALHGHGVLHRDLKPSNVHVLQVGQEVQVKLFDLGLARVAGMARITRPGVVHGTAHYMAPEQALGGTLDVRTDIYALGVVLFELATGGVPFPGRSYAKVLQGHMNTPPPPLCDGANGDPALTMLEPIVHQCLAKKPAERFSDASQLRLALEHLDGELRTL